MPVRKATLHDLDQLAVLFDGYRVFYEKPSDVDGARVFLKARLEQHDSEIFVHHDGNHLTGFVQLYPLFSSTRMKRLWLLNDLFVQPEHRGKGISVGLIDAAKDLCRASQSCGMMLETAKSNAIGNKLYPATGFSLDGDHNYYSWDTD
jgi:GNAT superfamily N-acetyltransferase